MKRGIYLLHTNLAKEQFSNLLKASIILSLLLLYSVSTFGQKFGSQNIIYYTNAGPDKVIAEDIDQDGDQDVLSASLWSNLLVWQENQGANGFQTDTITQNLANTIDIDVGDVDQDGNMDVMAVSWSKIYWFENDGQQNFTSHVVANVNGAYQIRDADLDNDQDMDLVVAVEGAKELVWFENDGQQNFQKHVIGTGIAGVQDLQVIDINGDQNLDIAAASSSNNAVYWFENDGQQNFTQHTLTSNAKGAIAVDVIDLDQDGDQDILSASCQDHKIAWYENNGKQAFTTHVISSSTNGAYDVMAADLSGNDQLDIAAVAGDEVLFFENDSSQNFTKYKVSSSAYGARGVFVADLNGDNKKDILSASFNDYKVSWYKNLMNSNSGNSGNTGNNSGNGNVLRFDGNDDYVYVPALGFSGDQSITVSGWVKVDSNAGKKNNVFGFGSSFTGNKSFSIRTHGNGKFRCYFGSDYLDANTSNYYGEWIHLSAVYNASKSKRTIYVNGEEIASDAPADPNFSNMAYSIGGFNDEYFNGSVKEIRVWKSARSQSEIRGNMCKDLNGSTYSNLVGYWNFRDMNGNIVSDRAGINNGLVISDPLWVMDSSDNCNTIDTCRCGTKCGHSASKVVSYNQGTKINGSPVKTSRRNPSNVLGKPDKQFFSLGFSSYSYVTVAFDSFMTGDLSIHEISWNSTNYLEKAKVYVSQDMASWTYAGEADNQDNPKGDIHTFVFHLDTLRYKYVKLVNSTDKNSFTSTADGFDVSAVCAEKVASKQIMLEAGIFGIGRFQSSLWHINQSNANTTLVPGAVKSSSRACAFAKNKQMLIYSGFSSPYNAYSYPFDTVKQGGSYISANQNFSKMTADNQGNVYVVRPNNILYKLDTQTNSAKKIARIKGLISKGVWGDIAMVSRQTMYILAKSGLYSIDMSSYKATYIGKPGWIGAGRWPTGLAMNEKGDLYATDNGRGNSSSNLYKINPSTASSTLIGNTGKVIGDLATSYFSPVSSYANSYMATGINDNTSEEKDENRITIYPNPVNKGRSIILAFNKSPEERKSIKLFDNNGKFIDLLFLNKGQKQLKISTNRLSRGIYILQTGGQKNKKFIVH